MGEGGAVAERKSVVLVVEDDIEMRHLLCDELWSEGYQLREAKDGDEALQNVMRAIPDLILTDLRMPAGGPDYICRLRTVAPQCPIIVMTAFGDTKAKAEVMHAGATAYFDKPVRVAEIKRSMRSLLGDHPQVPSGPA